MFTQKFKSHTENTVVYSPNQLRHKKVSQTVGDGQGTSKNKVNANDFNDYTNINTDGEKFHIE